ncbi:MAG: galactose mutarotase [Bacteroidales bacterium]|nr:galactose mutarotase [Bacteroidales bacterium]
MKKILFLFSSVCIFIILATSCVPKAETADKQIQSLLIPAENFDTIVDGEPIELFTLKNPGGIAVQLTNYGATIVSVITPDSNGKYADIVLGYKEISSYLTDNMYLGCIVGPFANRIAKGKFELEGQEYHLDINNGENTLHSGKNTFAKKIWKAHQNNNSVSMTYEAKDLEAGFPGNVTATAIYTLKPDNSLELKITAVSDKKTVINLTNHAYFNLEGEGSGSILNEIIRINADAITPVDSALIPTGELMPVEGTPFDFRKDTAIAAGINNADNLQIKFGKGYDHNWVLNGNPGELKLAVKLVDPESKRYLELYTNQPGLQFYSGNFMDGSVTGKSGKKYNFRNALALEPQFFPDSPNQPGFPSTLLEPGMSYEHLTVYSFGVEK